MIRTLRHTTIYGALSIVRFDYCVTLIYPVTDGAENYPLTTPNAPSHQAGAFGISQVGRSHTMDPDSTVVPELVPTADDLREAIHFHAQAAARLPDHWVDKRAAFHARINGMLDDLEALNGLT